MGPLYSSIKSETYSFYYVCFTLHFEQYYENLLEIDLNCFIEKLDIFAQEQGLESVNSKQKLQTYKKYKTKLEPEDYVLRLMSRYHGQRLPNLGVEFCPYQ